MNSIKKFNLLTYIGPGILIAATGVGAGDLATGAFAGSKLGVAVLWAVIIGAFLKFIVTEGLTRWQLATGQTLLEGTVYHLGRPVQYFFLAYLLIWTFCVGSALISACGVAAHALIPVFDDPDHARIVFGILHSLLGLTFVLLGTFKTFEKVMSIGIGMMFLTVVITAFLIQPDWSAILKGILIPTIPESLNSGGKDQGVLWTLGLIGGVGGTLTLLSYGYWIREENRKGIEALKLCRIDLIVSYSMIALFGSSMVIIASQIDLEQQSSSAMLIVTLTNQLRDSVGIVGSITFLIGAWAAIFSSLLGVWQSVPYMFADFWSLFRQHGKMNMSQLAPIKVNTKGLAYRSYLFTIALIPMIGLRYKFVFVQKIYAVFGSLVIPMLALILLILNGRSALVGRHNKNGLIVIILLVSTLLFFAYLSMPKIYAAIVSMF